MKYLVMYVSATNVDLDDLAYIACLFAYRG